MNPHAGSGKGLDRWERVERVVSANGIRPFVSITQVKGDATRLAREAVQSGFSTVVAVGGDGTIHEVVNGLGLEQESLPSVRLGLVPAGTGMDFARNLGMRRGLRAASDRLLHPVERQIDIGVSLLPVLRLFVNFAETGIGATVVAREAQLHRRLPGRVSYLLSAIDAIRSQHNIRGRIAVDGLNVYEGSLVSIVVANGPYFAGGMKIAPGARLDDKSLEVLVLGDFSRGELLTHVWRIYPGIHVNLAKVASLRGQEVTIEFDGSSRLDLDGELYGEGPYAFSVSPRALRVLV